MACVGYMCGGSVFVGVGGVGDEWHLWGRGVCGGLWRVCVCVWEGAGGLGGYGGLCWGSNADWIQPVLMEQCFDAAPIEA